MTTSGAIMDTRWKVKILAPLTKNLSRQQSAFLRALEERLREEDLNVINLESIGRAVGIDARHKELRGCDGIIILAFEQWKARRLNGGEDAVMPSEFTHIGVVQAAVSERPYLILREKSLSSRGTLRNGFADAPLDLPKSLGPDWLKKEPFKTELARFLVRVRARYHVFLGYSSQAETVADKVARFLTERLKLRVYDWKRFPAGKSIWESIGDAERRSNCGLFLFMKDDVIGYGEDQKLGPRDNVIFEAGYFAGTKSRSLVIREKDAKLPTDFGGIVCLELPNRESIAAIETKLTEEIERQLTGVY
jgi:hypothetical protein